MSKTTNKQFDEAVAVSRESIDAYVQSSKTLTTGFETLIKEYIEYSNKAFDNAIEASKALTSVKTPQEAIDLQSKIARETFEEMVDEGKKVSDMTAGIIKEAFEPISGQVQKAVDLATKKAA